jgi:hypothetical protein
MIISSDYYDLNEELDEEYSELVKECQTSIAVCIVQ